ncbi:UDP-N-acetylglucosamine 2-epimerase (non-hydrolyzing) [Methanolinea mesophila]|uniref:non-hydrolyzing UDP-N-acetylglucosamine 2-epimerase n=1 Tax=Methanolinea mesophila TaxID=547055 RepID=UPI001AE41DCA|nr:UDP-N-acetylglucosamine 2-epimerase (non-hydrolyzing) [Methanolinea mesophila]MBP1928356.1 UDP-N-acetylglucosamine 2-epimerase (non-hydrolyzing) [Methanolinea mesophila]
MKIVTIVGARPQFIKCAPLSRELRKKHTELLVHTGQHYDLEMSDIFFEELHIPKPDYYLGVGSGSHGKQTGKILAKVEEVLIKEKPELVLVYGDTNSTLAGALAAAKLHIPVAHVEAGLRSFDRTMPEEINRVLTDHISDLLFCPTQTGIDNLAQEGIKSGVHLTGDVMVDALEYNREIAEEKSRILERFALVPGSYLVVTVHRPSNTDNREHMEAILSALGRSGKRVVFPIHPRTRKCLSDYGLLDTLPANIILSESLGYLDMIRLMAHAEKILTDSGGMQKEAYLLNVPCITLRENTEWVETVKDGWNVLVGADYFMILSEIVNIKSSKRKIGVFGTIGASRRIADILNSIKIC